MKSTIRTKLLPLAIATLLTASPAMAQDTSSAISGRVLDASGQPVAGATVQIVHEPSGTTKITTTGADGRYSAQGLRVGGPFDVTVSKAGQAQAVQNNVYLQLAQETPVNLTMGAEQAKNVQNLSGVTVSANALAQTFSSDNKGISTNVSQREIEATPTPGRSIQNIVRLDPRIVISDRDRGEISAIGQNSRYNNITVDSVSANDPFGLNANGLPTLGTPISQDTIQEYNISTANYDVATRRGVGAIVNAVTKSGTNDFHGSAYYAFQNRSDMIADYNDKPYGGFRRTWTAGATVGGPIIKDKLFFFASYEKSKQIGPSSQYGVQGSGAATEVRGLTQQNVDDITAAAKAKGFDVGGLGGGNSDLQDKRYLGKIDWNITNNHRASFTYSQTKETKPIITGNNNILVLSSGWYKTNVDNKSYALHFYDDWSDIFSTDTTVSYADFQQNRGPYNGVAQPDVSVCVNGTSGCTSTSSSPGVEFGTEYSSQANILHVKTLNAAWAGTLYLGEHTVKGGFDFQRGQYYNLFLQNAFGSYQFNTLADFKAGNYYQYRYNAPAAGLGLNDVAANFELKEYGVFLQDTWQVNSNLSVQYGFRVDIPLTGDRPLYNPCYAAAPGQAVVAANCVSPKGGFGHTNTSTINGNRQVQPRASFNYTFDTERMTQLRGGAGLFISNPPSVWLGNIYQNSGVTQVQYNCGPSQSVCNNKNGNVLPPFSADPNGQNGGSAAIPGASGAQMAVSTVSDNFAIPSVWKMSLGFDRELPWWGVVFSADYEHIKNRNAIWYQNLNIGASTGVLPDGRLTYYKDKNSGSVLIDPATGAPILVGGKTQSNTARANSNPSFGDAVINLANSDQGSADSLSLALKKPFADEWSAMAGFTWSRATEVNPGTSSVARSSYSNNVWVNPNENKASTSSYSIPKRVIASLTWQHRFFGDYATSATVFYDGHSGTPYSWRFGNDANGDGFVSDLAYIPNKGDISFAPGTTQAQQDSFWQYIDSDKYLKDHKGQIASRNGARAAWINQVDLSFTQEIPGLFKGNKGMLRLDVYNLGNMLNKKWGVDHRASFPLVRNLADFAGVDANGKYIYDISKAAYKDANGNYSPLALPRADELNGPTQRWSILATVRYTF